MSSRALKFAEQMSWLELSKTNLSLPLDTKRDVKMHHAATLAALRRFCFLITPASQWFNMQAGTSGHTLSVSKATGFSPRWLEKKWGGHPCLICGELYKNPRLSRPITYHRSGCLWDNLQRPEVKAQPHVLVLGLNNQVQVKQTAVEGMFSKEPRIQLRVISVH